MTKLEFKGAKASVHGNCYASECTTREEYLHSLKLLTSIHTWRTAKIGVLSANITGMPRGTDFHGFSRAGEQGLQTHQVSSLDEARQKTIASMRAWVVRNIPDAKTEAKQRSMIPGPAEQRAMALLVEVEGNQLVRYRGGNWSRPGLRMIGDLPEEAPHTGIAILRKLAAKKLVHLDEAKGVATLIID